MPPEIRKLADRFLSNPKTVTVSPPASTGENVTQIFAMLDQNNDWLKREALRARARGGGRLRDLGLHRGLMQRALLCASIIALKPA